jgi:uncharacterized protein (DUF2147 family)
MISQCLAEISGDWLTADKKGVIRIYLDHDRYQGKIVSSENLPHQVNQVILKNLKEEQPNLYYGSLLDPETGSEYKCKIEKREKKLKVRGYMGIPFFGKTFYWDRLNN